MTTIEIKTDIDEWLQKSMCYRWLHRKASSFYYKLDLFFTYTIVFIGFCNAITTFVCNTYFNEDPRVKELETFFVTSASLAISGIAQLHRKAKFYETSEQHNNHSRKFEVFTRKIRNESIMCECSPEHIKEIIAEYDELANTAPYIPSKVLKIFNRKYGNLQIWKPNALYGLDDIKAKQTNSTLRNSFYVWKLIKSKD